MAIRKPVPAQTWPPLVAALLLAVGLITYLPALDGKLLWDDDAHVTAPALRSLGGLWRIWTDSRATQQYYPLLHSAFWVQYQLWGLATVGYHVVNVVLHVVGAVLLWRILAGLAVPGALLAALIWALHPVAVESVAWISELKNTLSGALYFAAMLAYLRFDPPRAPGEAGPAEGARAGGAGGARLYGLAFALFVGALLSKTVTASLPAALALIFWWKEGRIDWTRRWLPLTPFFLVGLALGLTTAWVERVVLGATGDAFALGWPERILVAGRALWFYLSKLAWPAELSFVYPRWIIDRWEGWQYLYPVAAVAAVAALWALRPRLGRGPLAAALFFGGTLMPALGFFNVYTFNYTFVADHFQYLASAGAIAAAAAAIATGLGRLGVWGKPAGVAACAALLLVLAGLSWRQAHLYTDLETLYREVVARNPAGTLAYLNLGVVYHRQARYEEAIRVYRNLIAMRPGYTRAYSNLGAVYASLGRHAEAAAVYEQALAIDPQFAEVRHHLGLAHEAQGRREEAIAEYRAALALRPDLAVASLSLGRALVAAGRPAEAIEPLKAALAGKPDLAEAHYTLGLSYGALGQPAAAVEAYRAAVAAAPTYADAFNNLGIEYRKQGQFAEAIAAYRSAIAVRPGFAAAHNNLGAAYAAQANYAEAVSAWQNAVRFEPDSPVGRAAQRNLELVRPLVRP
jgi:tetratricopeptide (TPR) repeat protein